MRRVLILAALMLTGCIATLSPEGAQVRSIGGDLSKVKGCEPIQMISATATVWGDAGRDSAVTELRNTAAGLGANAIVYAITAESAWGTGPTASGTAYHCPGQAAVIAPPTQPLKEYHQETERRTFPWSPSVKD